jgi:hypothetical protein
MVVDKVLVVVQVLLLVLEIMQVEHQEAILILVRVAVVLVQQVRHQRVVFVVLEDLEYSQLLVGFQQHMLVVAAVAHAFLVVVLQLQVESVVVEQVALEVVQDQEAEQTEL